MAEDVNLVSGKGVISITLYLGTHVILVAPVKNPQPVILVFHKFWPKFVSYKNIFDPVKLFILFSLL